MVQIKTLIGSLLVLLALGTLYAWSLFNLPLSQKYGLDIDVIAFTFGIMTLFLALGSLSSGFLKLRIGMQNVVALSAVCSGVGLLGAAFAPNVFVLYLCAGTLVGFGNGLGYMLVLTNCVKFFPNQKGLISAMCIGAYGLGSLLFKSVDSYMLGNFGVETALLNWGVVITAAVTLGSVLIYDAMKFINTTSSAASKREYDLHSAIRTLPYWLLSLMFFIDCMIGLYIIGVASNLGTALLDMTLSEAATAVSVVAIANISGRLLMGVLSDKLPRIRLITFDQVLSLIAIIMFVAIPLTPTLFFAAIALIAFSFGGTLTIYPSIMGDFFGIRNLAKNYGLLYLGFGIGSLFGYVVAYAFGSYNITFIIMGVMVTIAIIASLMVKLPAELAESHKELVRTNKIRTDEEAAVAATAAWKQASAAFDAPSCPVTLGQGKSANPAVIAAAQAAAKAAATASAAAQAAANAAANAVAASEANEASSATQPTASTQSAANNAAASEAKSTLAASSDSTSPSSSAKNDDLTVESIGAAPAQSHSAAKI